MDDRSVTPEVRAGDPFYAASRQDDQDERPHACYEGWVFLGFETEAVGELVEVTDCVPCRRCQRAEG